MHVAFIPYGKRDLIEKMLRDMEAQKHLLNMTKKGKKDVGIWIESQIRMVPGGIYEYVFPKEDLATVLTTLDFDKSGEGNYMISKTKLAILRKILRLKKAPKFKPDKKYLWIKKWVSIIPIGIREDGVITETSGEYKGYEHEAI